MEGTLALTNQCRRRLERVARSWSPYVTKELVRYAGGHRAIRGAARATPDRSWMLFPRWLCAHAARRHTARPSRSFLADVTWGQYCLFLAIRLQDDLFDDHTRSPALVFVADALLVEAERAFARHLRSRQFWEYFRSRVADTAAAILEADALQRRRRGMPRDGARIYAEVSSIFKVGSAAVCFRCGLAGALPRVARCADALAVADQIIDDLSDLDEDLRRGRLNYAASRMLADPRDGVDALLTRAGRELEAARAAIAPLRLPGAERYFGSLDRAFRRLRGAIHRAQVAAVFSAAGIRGASGPRPGRRSRR